MSWATPFVLGIFIGGVAGLLLFAVIEQRVKSFRKQENS